MSTRCTENKAHLGWESWEFAAVATNPNRVSSDEEDLLDNSLNSPTCCLFLARVSSGVSTKPHVLQLEYYYSQRRKKDNRIPFRLVGL